MSFRGINTTVIQIRRQVFTEVARMAYANVKGEDEGAISRWGVGQGGAGS